MCEIQIVQKRNFHQKQDLRWLEFACELLPAAHLGISSEISLPVYSSGAALCLPYADLLLQTLVAALNKHHLFTHGRQ